MLKATILDSNEPVSKALNSLLKTGTIVVITKNKKYFGIIEDRDLKRTFSDPSKIKCGSIAIRAPAISEDGNVESMIASFLAGHFKGLPVIEKNRILGIYTRADLLRLLSRKKLIPKTNVAALMKTPLYTIEYNECMQVAKGLMRELNVHRLAVKRKGRVIGSISTLDFAVLMLKPKGRDRFSNIPSLKNQDEKPVSDLVREIPVKVKEDDSLHSAVSEMAKRNVSAAIVMDSRNKAIGILTAADIMKFIKKLYFTKSLNIFISGLGEDEMMYYNAIRDEVEALVKKYKSMEITGVDINLKKGKSTYTMRLRLEAASFRLSMGTEGYGLVEVRREVLEELRRLLNKRKSKKSKRKVIIYESEFV